MSVEVTGNGGNLETQDQLVGVVGKLGRVLRDVKGDHERVLLEIERYGSVLLPRFCVCSISWTYREPEEDESEDLGRDDMSREPGVAVLLHPVLVAAKTRRKRASAPAFLRTTRREGTYS